MENRTFEVRSHSAHHVLTLRCMNSMEADSWFESIHVAADALLTQALAQVNLILGQNPQVRRMGWLAEQVSEKRKFCIEFISELVRENQVLLLIHH